MIVMHSVVRACPGYSRHDAPAILMDGTSIDRETEHGKAVTAQLTRRHDTLAEAIDAGGYALAAAGITRGIRRQAQAAAEDYFYERLGLSPDAALDPRRPIGHETLEPMPEEMYRALETVVEYVVDGDYEELRELSRGLLGIEDLRRRVEDECPEALALPPREHYLVEAIAKSDDPGEPDFSYFLDLWTEDGPARLHIEGVLAESGGRYEVALTDVAP